jgi:hypothetical protein
LHFRGVFTPFPIEFLKIFQEKARDTGNASAKPDRPFCGLSAVGYR